MGVEVRSDRKRTMVFRVTGMGMSKKYDVLIIDSKKYLIQKNLPNPRRNQRGYTHYLTSSHLKLASAPNGWRYMFSMFERSKYASPF